MTSLPRPVIGLGGALGYAPGDLAAAGVAAERGELPVLVRDDVESVVELRVHGVGGAPADVNLGAPATLQVAGDAAAGFHRAWFPGRRDQHDPAAWPPVGGRPARREAYCWGRLNTASWSRALWLLLVAFAVTDLAHWALPSPRRGGLAFVGRAVVRLAALTMTAATVQTASLLLVDVVARQALAREVGPTWFAGLGAVALPVRQGVALALVVLGVAVLLGLSRATGRAYEQWPAPPVDVGPDTPALRRTEIWSGARTLARQRIAHALVAIGAVALTASTFDGLPDGIRLLLRGWAVVAVALAVALTVSPWVDRLASRTAVGPPTAVSRSCLLPTAALLAALVPVGLGTAFAATPSDTTPGALPGDLAVQEWLVVVELGWCVVLAVVVALTRPRQRAAFLAGFAAPVLLLFATLIAVVFGAAVSLVTANVLGTPDGTGAPRPGGRSQLLQLPVTVFAGGFAFGVTLVSLVVVGLLGAVARARRRRRLLGAAPARAGEVPVREIYGDAAVAAAGHHAGGVAGAWATAAVTDAAGRVLAGVSLATAVAFGAYVLLARSGDLPQLVRDAAGYGGSAAAAVTLAFVVVLRQSIVSEAGRKRFGLLWDVVTFWPRAAHPLAPPCYAERTIPELVTRVRRLAGDVDRSDAAADGVRPPDLAAALARTEHAATTATGAGRVVAEPPAPVLLVGYSQGTPISVATVAMLPAPVLERVALLTLAAPVYRLYGRAFPAWFGPDQLAAVQRSLTGPNGPRWRNVVRASDYIGGWVRAPWPPTADGVDRWVADPPVLAVADDPAPPPVHRHSDWFPDPQTRPFADELVRLLPPAPVTPAAAAPATGRAAASPGTRS